MVVSISIIIFKRIFKVRRPTIEGPADRNALTEKRGSVEIKENGKSSLPQIRAQFVYISFTKFGRSSIKILFKIATVKKNNKKK